MAPSDGQSDEVPSNGDGPDADDGSRPVWVRGAIFVGLGVEFVGLVVGGLFLGHILDETFETAPALTLVCFVGSLVAVAFHIYRMLDLT